MTPGPPRAKHGREKREIALAAYAASGSWRHAARVSGVPEPTIRRWAAQEPDQVTVLREQAAQAIGERVRRALAMAVDHAAARLEAGCEEVSLHELTGIVRDLSSASGRLADIAQAKAWLAKEMSALVKRIGERDPELLRRVVAHLERHEPALSESL